MTTAIPTCNAAHVGRDATNLELLTLRDGSTVQIRVSEPADRDGLLEFFRRLSPESRWHRFRSLTLPRPQLIADLCDSSRPHSQLTLLAMRREGGVPRIIATGSYLATDARAAEVAFAVADDWRGKGLGTLLLERLARIAVCHGFTRFWALTRTDNLPMLDVFRESGFAETERPERDEIEVEMTLVPTKAGVPPPTEPATLARAC